MQSTVKSCSIHGIAISGGPVRGGRFPAFRGNISKNIFAVLHRKLPMTFPMKFPKNIALPGFRNRKPEGFTGLAG